MLWFIVTTAVLAVLTVFCLIRTERSGKTIAPYVTHLLIWILIPLATNAVLSFSADPIVIKFCYTAYFISTTILLCYLVSFTLVYCGYQYKLDTVKKVLLGIAVFDALNILINWFTGHVFILTDTVNEGGADIGFVPAWYHKIHLILSAVLILLALNALVMKMMSSSKLYRDRYLSIFAALTVTTVFEMIHIIANNTVDRSIIGIAVCGIFVYIYSIEYVPSALMDEMKKTVLSSISDGILFFDENRNCIFANEAARFMLNIDSNNLSSGLEKLLALTGEEPESSAQYNSKILTCTMTENGQEYIYDVEGHKLHDLQGKLIGSFAKITDTTERTHRENMNRFLATHDKLTGIYNTDRLYDSVREVLKENPDKDFYIMTSDIKEFKLVNDRYGRNFADKLLIRIAELFKEKAVSSTTRYGRLSGDKFGCIIAKENYNEQIIIQAMNEVPNVGLNVVIPIIIHAGVYEIEDRNMPVSAMFDRASIAISAIKHDASLKVAYYEDNARDEMLWGQKVTEQIDNAILTGQIVPYLQAQVSREGKVVGAEVLVRWIHPDEGFMPPGKFLSILEKNGMIGKIDMYIWECACRILRRWAYEGRNDLYLSVNISPKDFYLMDVPAVIIDLADKYELDRKKLRLEITETIMMDDIEEKLKTIDRLREAGFIVEMDDFGSGYSSLNMLKDMPVDVLKLDMIFLKDNSANERTRKIMALIIDLAKSLDVPVIAEGVETVEQVDFLAQLGCDFFQGYYFARPVSLDEYEKKNLTA